jgi:hypothetical protein
VNHSDPDTTATELLTDFCNQFNEICQQFSQPPIPESPAIKAALDLLNRKLETLLLMKEFGIVPENCHPSWKQCFQPVDE